MALPFYAGQKPYEKVVFQFSHHIYHEDGWASNYERPEALIRFLVNRPALDYYTVWESGKKLIEQGKPFNLNEDNWGYSDIDLEEYIFEPN